MFEAPSSASFPGRSWLRVAAVLALVVLVSSLVRDSAQESWWARHNAFGAFDDEGYVMISLSSFVKGHALYDDVFTQYGPFFYALLARWGYRRPPILFLEHGRHFPDYPRRKRILANRLLLDFLQAAA